MYFLCRGKRGLFDFLLYKGDFTEAQKSTIVYCPCPTNSLSFAGWLVPLASKATPSSSINGFPGQLCLVTSTNSLFFLLGCTLAVVSILGTSSLSSSGVAPKLWYSWRRGMASGWLRFSSRNALSLALYSLMSSSLIQTAPHRLSDYRVSQ